MYFRNTLVPGPKPLKKFTISFLFVGNVGLRIIHSIVTKPGGPTAAVRSRKENHVDRMILEDYIKIVDTWIHDPYNNNCRDRLVNKIVSNGSWGSVERICADFRGTD